MLHVEKPKADRLHNGAPETLHSRDWMPSTSRRKKPPGCTLIDTRSILCHGEFTEAGCLQGHPIPAKNTACDATDLKDFCRGTEDDLERTTAHDGFVS